eukprot:TRINITY_DN6063_c0_g1_i1.p1 TRINITY_DN6063_c0_g1~~TRINITY_DN6063_c0_g1_i1.p1  ORF type:complete len:925 (+),score=193.04 TRINITY_DN6063_c0_g1_i1:24-2798(+)
MNNFARRFLRREQQVRLWIEAVLEEQFSIEWKDELRDGIKLCRLMLIINDRSIPTISYSHHHFKKKENILFFLTACKDLGVSPWYLFDIPDLYDARNLIKVIECIEAVAKLVEMRGFEPKYSSFKNIILPSDDIRKFDKTIENLLRENLKRRESQKLAFKRSRMHLQEMASSIHNRSSKNILAYAPNFTQRIQSGVVLLQALIRRGVAIRKHQKLVVEWAYRTKIANEIYQTEKAYVSTLSSVIKLYIEPLRNHSETEQPFITSTQIKTIFSCLEVIYAYNKNLLESISQRFHSWSPNQYLGDIFLEINQYMKTYTQYVKDYEGAVKQLNVCKLNPKFLDFLNQVQNLPESNKNTINSLLIMPVQRIPRYELLLRDLVRHTPKYHRDYSNLKEALACMQNISLYMEEKKKEYECIDRVHEIQKSFVGTAPILALPHRKYVREGPLLVLPENKGRWFYLFNDLLVVSKRLSHKKSTIRSKNRVRKEEFKYLNSVSLSQNNLVDIPASPLGGHCFGLSRMGMPLLVLSAQTPEEKTGWMKDLSRLLLYQAEGTYLRLVRVPEQNTPESVTKRKHGRSRIQQRTATILKRTADLPKKLKSTSKLLLHRPSSSSSVLPTATSPLTRTPTDPALLPRAQSNQTPSTSPTSDSTGDLPLSSPGQLTVSSQPVDRVDPSNHSLANDLSNSKRSTSKHQLVLRASNSLSSVPLSTSSSQSSPSSDLKTSPLPSLTFSTPIDDPSRSGLTRQIGGRFKSTKTFINQKIGYNSNPVSPLPSSRAIIWEPEQYDDLTSSFEEDPSLDDMKTNYHHNTPPKDDVVKKNQKLIALFDEQIRKSSHSLRKNNSAGSGLEYQNRSSPDSPLKNESGQPSKSKGGKIAQMVRMYDQKVLSSISTPVLATQPTFSQPSLPEVEDDDLVEEYDYEWEYVYEE